MATLFYHQSMSELARAVAQETPVLLGEILWDKFPDGWPNLFIRDVKTVRQQKVVFLASFESPCSVVEQFAVIEAFPRYFAASIQIVLPFFPVGTMERIDRDGEVPTAVTMSRLLSSISPCRPGGPTLITTFDIHALQERFYFGDMVIANLLSAIPLLKHKLSKFNPATVAIAFPDDGARKRFGHMFMGMPIILCEKKRKGDKREVRITEGEPAGRDIVIVDDLIQTGGTMIEAARALRRAGASSVSAYATHGVFPQEAWRRFTSDIFAKVWVTDSCPRTSEKVKALDHFEVLSLAPLIAECLSA